MQNRYVIGSVGPGGLDYARRKCVGGKVARRDRGRQFNSVRRQADKADISEQLGELEELHAAVGVNWMAIQMGIFFGEHHDRLDEFEEWFVEMTDAENILGDEHRFGTLAEMIEYFERMMAW